jgi:hypothetical protein
MTQSKRGTVAASVVRKPWLKKRFARRIKRSAVERTRTILEAERRYVADLESVVSHLRGVTAQISGVEVAA